MWLLIDDVRESMGCDVIARNSKAAEHLLKLKIWECVVFDNDLGHDSKEGWQLLEWALSENLLPNDIQLVTSNPSAKNRMALALEDAGYIGDSSKRIFCKLDDKTDKTT